MYEKNIHVNRLCGLPVFVTLPLFLLWFAGCTVLGKKRHIYSVTTEHTAQAQHTCSDHTHTHVGAHESPFVLTRLTHLYTTDRAGQALACSGDQNTAKF